MRVKVINKRPASVLQKKRVCAYARVSTDSRRQEDSLENQMETYERLITGNPEYEFIGVFADQGISGYCENRPQFQRMMEKARAGEIDLIITKSISRREMEATPDLLIAAQPTRGVDIGAIESIHHRIVEVRDSGRGVLLVSAELDEILSLSDRILVMYEGEIMAEFKRGEADERKIAVYMTGAKRQGGDDDEE